MGSLGDTIVALPCFHLIARRFPKAQRVLLSDFPYTVNAPASSAVIGESGLIHGYMRFSKGTRNPRELLSLWWRIARFRPQVLVYLMGNLERRVVNRNLSFFRLAGIRHVIGAPDTSSPAWQCDAETGFYEHEATRLARCVAALGDCRLSDPNSWDLRLTQAEITRGEERISALRGRPFIACSLGTKQQANDWTIANWTILLRKLNKTHPGYSLLLVGSSGEREASQKLAEAWDSPAINACGELAPRETAAALRHATFYIGHDSGPMHLAACVQIPCVGIYGARHYPGKWFPFGDRHQIVHHDVECKGCELSVCVEQRKKCILSITPDEVLQSIQKVLKHDRYVSIAL